MKKILFTVVATLIISSCTTGNGNDEATFIVKFKDGTEMKVVGTDAKAKMIIELDKMLNKK